MVTFCDCEICRKHKESVMTTFTKKMEKENTPDPKDVSYYKNKIKKAIDFMENQTREFKERGPYLAIIENTLRILKEK
jgi:hypothetical protein